MRLEVVDAVSQAGVRHNEDIWGATAQAAWIFDGATGIWPHNRFGGPSEAAWLVAQGDAALRRRLEADGTATPVREMLAQMAEETLEAARLACELDGVAPHELPSASVAMVRAVAGGLELSNLGDCAVVCRLDRGPARRYGSSGVAKLDARLHRAIGEHLDRGLSLAEAQAEARGLILRHRALMNCPRGYWIYDLSGRGALHAQVRTVRARAGELVLLVTDGFYRLVDTYGRYDWPGLLDAAAAHGVARLCQELRDIEAGDPECRAYRRNKPRDDATAVLLRLT